MPDAMEPLSFRFDDFLLDRAAGALLRLHPNGQTSRVPLGGRAYQLLCLLLERRGGIVSRQEIMDTVWPDVFVEENNLSVQLSNLRRALDADRGGGSCVQTVPGRGYRFLPEVIPVVGWPVFQAAGPLDPNGPAPAGAGTAGAAVETGGKPPPTSERPSVNPLGPALPGANEAECHASGNSGEVGPAALAPPEAAHAAASSRLRQHGLWIAGACVGLGVLIAILARLTAFENTSNGVPTAATAPSASPAAVLATATPVDAPSVSTQNAAPAVTERGRLSIVVLPFTKLGDGVDDLTVETITEDLTTAITRGHAPGVTVRRAAPAYDGKPIDIRRIGEALGVRYAVEGSVRRIGATLRVSVRLVSAETGVHIWADHFDAAPETGGYTLEEIVRHIVLAVLFKALDTESARIARENPGSTDAADAHLRARAALYVRPPHPQTQDQVIAMLERALALDPNVAAGWAGLVEALLGSIDIWTDDPTAPAKIRRAEQAVLRAELLGPEEGLVVGVRVPVLMMLGRCAEVPAAAQRVSAAHPTLAAPSMILGFCLLRDGRAAEAIPHFEQSIRVNPRNPGVFIRYLAMGYALLFLERYEEAIAWFRKTLVAHPGNSALNQGNLHAAIAAAQALAGDIAAARDSAAEAGRLWPTLTARSYFPIKVFSPAAAAQVARMRDGLRLAGIRDHADEDANPGLPEDDVLRTAYNALTPAGAPGVRTLRTADLAALLDRRKPLVLDASNPWGPSVPGAIVLPGAGVGGTTTDDVQERLRLKMAQLTGGDRTMPVVTVGWNAERHQGRNLALRLAALGYTEVHWYRGGREAWAAAGLPTAEVAVQDW